MPSRAANCRPILDLPDPMKPMSTILEYLNFPRDAPPPPA